MFTSTVFSISLSLLNIPSTFLTYISCLIFFSLNPCFLANSELMTNPVAPLSNNASTVISFCISILSSSIFTVTSLSMFLLSRLQQDILFTTLLSIANMLLLRSNWGLLDLPPHLNCPYYFYCSCISFFFLCPWFIFYNFTLDGQILHNYRSFFSCPHLWYMDYTMPILSFKWGTPLLPACYELKLLGLSNRTTLVLSNTRELNRKPFTK